jgi:hypothetical protein
MKGMNKEEAERLAQQERDRHRAIVEQKEVEGTEMETKPEKNNNNHS